MIYLRYPENNSPERAYAIEVLLGQILGLKYKYNGVSPDENYQLILENGNVLVFEDHFFNSTPEPLSYLDKNKIPEDILYTRNQFTPEDNVPIIYGTTNLSVGKEKIICGIDIFASSFFMLTRWEEHIEESRDEHNRFLACYSLASRSNFLDRPIVNEYAEMLWNMLVFLNIEKQRKELSYNFFVTHDVDQPFFFGLGLCAIFKNILGDIFVRKNYKGGFKKIFLFAKVRAGKTQDPYDTFDYLMETSEKNGLKGHFYFMATGETKFDNAYSLKDSRIPSLIRKITDKGHIIGIHPTYNSYNNASRLAAEKQEIQDSLKVKVISGRQHYLRFSLPETWIVWEENGLSTDSSLGYADKEGFRCGICSEYPTFNILSRKQLNLKERPLVVMDGTFFTYQKNLSLEEIEKRILSLIRKVKKYKGDFVFLWHNTTFEVVDHSNIFSFYERIIKTGGQNGK